MRRTLAEGPRLYAAVFLFAVALIFLRRPDALLHAQFWAEDGAVWYRHAHDLGALRPFLMTQDGYFSTYLRIAALAAQSVPLALAPLFLAVIAFALQAAPAVFLLSPRFKDAIPDMRARLALAVTYLLLPNTAEIHGNATNAQWYLALLAFMIVIARVPTSRAGKALDAATLALAGLSGPYAVFLTPLAWLRWRAEKNRQRLRQLAVLATTGATQLFALFVLNGGSRFGYRPNPDFGTLLAMLEKQVFAGGLLGIRGYRFVVERVPAPGLVLAALAVFCLSMLVIAAKRGSWHLRFLFAFAGMSFVTSLLAPNIGVTAGAEDYARRAWPTMFASSSGSRYWFLPILSLATVILWTQAKKNPRFLRVAGRVGLFLMALGMAADFRDPPLPDLDFPRYAAAYEALPDGQTVVIPLNPSGWEMSLTKK